MVADAWSNKNVDDFFICGYRVWMVYFWTIYCGKWKVFTVTTSISIIGFIRVNWVNAWWAIYYVLGCAIRLKYAHRWQTR